MNEELGRFSELVKKFEWKFAWKYAAKSLPHEYIVLNGSNQEIFALFDNLVKKYGEKRKFGSATYRYLFLGGFKYWRIGIILNREPWRGVFPW